MSDRVKVLFLIGVLASCDNNVVNGEIGLHNATSLPDKNSLAAGDPCGHIEVDARRPCKVSFLRLIAAPEDYDGRWIEVIGYYPASGAKVLFPGYESWNTNDNQVSLLMRGSDWYPQDDRGYFAAVGVFSFERRDMSLAPGLFRQFGVLSDVKGLYRVRLMTEREQECRKTGCSIIYQDGVVPVAYD